MPLQHMYGNASMQVPIQNAGLPNSTMQPSNLQTSNNNHLALFSSSESAAMSGWNHQSATKMAGQPNDQKVNIVYYG